jgi:hypothetical protein
MDEQRKDMQLPRHMASTWVYDARTWLDIDNVSAQEKTPITDEEIQEAGYYCDGQRYYGKSEHAFIDVYETTECDLNEYPFLVRATLLDHPCGFHTIYCPDFPSLVGLLNELLPIVGYAKQYGKHDGGGQDLGTISL